ncbi:MAG: ABC-F family ATP-binding cassette domain-containing protein [Microscillaceae bacterium]|nr:ABC-F family ATP-binding cassette domain-containing protein [Microscillaceae bacterium]
MNYLSVENLSKAFGEKVLFQQISFGLNKGQKVALIAKNGSGKTSLLRILTGLDTADSGSFSFRKDIQVGFLHQDPIFEPGHKILDAVLHSDNPIIQAIKNYEACLNQPDQHEAMQEAMLQMDNFKAWDYEIKIKQILSKLKVGDLDRSIDTLSGGQKKRVALAKLLINEPDFYILDEPTNHLDIEMIEWLEGFLSNQQISLLMVTHDRYFLERVCDQIIELDQGKIFQYSGNYSYFLEKKAEREEMEVKDKSKAQNLMRKELDWVRRQPKARGTKSKARLDAFQDIKKAANKQINRDNLQLDVKMTRLGKKILELEGLHKNYDDLKILDNFSYIFKRQEKVGIVGHNGVGKSTFLHIISGQMPPDQGQISVGETIVMGYYRQDGIKLAEDKRVIEVVQDIAEYIPMSQGQNLSASQLLERFLFSPKSQYSYVSTLSGGERRRLYLLTILAQNPNFLILDEPTNDLDILTLQVLEDFLEDFPGCLVLVSHDRYFLDKLVDHLLVFEGDGKILDYNGSYSEYQAFKEVEAEKAQKAQEEAKAKLKAKNAENLTASKTSDKKKLSFKEQKEYENLEQEIETLEKQKESIESELSEGTLDNKSIQQKSEELGKIIKLIEQKTDRWLELGE